MIDKNSYELSWIGKIAQQIGRRGDPKIIEKVIYAFTLLEQLKIAGLDLIFKGGTSLLLHCDEKPRRFSIDIDIITQVSKENLPDYLNRVVRLGIFTRWKDDNDRKTARGVPVGHYKFYFPTKVGSQSGEEPVLLDVLFSESPYPQLLQRRLSHQWLLTNDEYVTVQIPTVESITGDKLTAFAPNTTGILYEKNRPVEIIKQLYDLGVLFDMATEFPYIRQSYIKVVEEEIRYRKLSVSWQETLEDSIATGYLLAGRDARNEQFRHLQKGISNISNFILDSFHVGEAIICGAKVAYLSKMLRTENYSVQRYMHPESIENLTIGNPGYHKLNKLKKSLPEAFFYWYHALSL